MKTENTVMLLNLPSPPHTDVCRDWAGGFGIAYPVRRTEYGHSGAPFFYPFLAYASATLHAQNRECHVMDSQKLKLNMPQVLKAVSRLSPDIVFSQVGLPSLGGDLTLLSRIKEIVPNATIICVGTPCKVLQQEIFGKSKVDILSTCTYPYVFNVERLLGALERGEELNKVPSISYVKEERILTTNQILDQSLSKVPSPKYDNLDLNGYEDFRDIKGNHHSYISVLGSKGCPYGCYYCPYPLGFGTRWSRRLPADIASELEYLSSRGVKGLLFRDQSFAMNEKCTLEVCDLIARQKLDVVWSCEARVDHLNRNIIGAMEKAGCRAIELGVETGDELLIEQAKPPVNKDLTKRAFRLARDFGISTMAHVILGWPDETLESMKRTDRFVDELAPDRVNWNFMTPYPGTRLRAICEAYNLVLTNDWSQYTSHIVVMKTKHLTQNQIRTVANRIMRRHIRKEITKLLLSAPRRPQFVATELKGMYRDRMR